MPIGYLITVLFFGLCVLLQLIPVPRNPLVRVASFWTSMVVNEQPHWFAALLAAATGLAFAQGDIDSVFGWLTVGLALLTLVGLGQLLRRAFPSRGVLREAMRDFKSGEPGRLEAPAATLRTLVGPLAYGRRRVERVGDIAYGDGGQRNLLDIYRPRNGEVMGPTLIYLHGGGFKSGAKRREGQLALYRLASRGWVTISANYRLSPEVQFPEYVIDLKRVITWARSEGLEFGVDTERIFLAGGSAGGHIASTAALTANEPLLQPGFEEADTAVSGAIGLYGYYGGLEYGSLRPQGPLPSSPKALIHPGAPPFLVVHGSRDTVVGVSNAKSFTARLEKTGVPVAFAELDGAQHTFDLLRSIRNENVVDAIDDFARLVLNG